MATPRSPGDEPMFRGIAPLRGFGAEERDAEGVVHVAVRSFCRVQRLGSGRYLQCHLDFPAQRGELVASVGGRIVDRAELTTGWQRSAFELKDVPVPAELGLAFRDGAGKNVTGVRIRSLGVSDAWGQGQRKRLKCHVPFRDIAVFADFSVYPCCARQWLKDNQVAGNTGEQLLEEIWNGPQYQRVRRLFLEGRYDEVCRAEVCPYLTGEMKAGEPTPEIIAAVNEGHTAVAHGPQLLHHDIDRGCNLECVMCRNEKILPREENVDRGLRDIDDALALGSLRWMTFSGAGEIFAMKKVVQLLESQKLSARGVKLGVNTNLTHFTEKLWRRIGHNKFYTVTLSADGCSPEVYNAIRIGADWLEVAGNMRFAARLRREGQIECLVWNYTVMKQNIGDVGKAVALSRELGVDWIRLIAQLGELNRTDGNMFEDYDRTALDALHAELDRAGALDDPRVCISEIAMRDRRYRTPEFRLELAEHLYQRRNFGSDKSIPLVDRDWRKCLNLVTGVLSDVATGDVAALQHLTDDHLRFLERFAAYTQERCGVGPASGGEDSLAAEARRVAGRSRALVATRRGGSQGIVQRLLARTTAWCRSVR
ncbi:MAG TPA: SPASM domain-containing protein [Stellaceae bacterium]|jgi:MoaA/NifB/PqqE/SkfB family radical SAM enzyme|nr:SPASM domain-containing protein [Stellaceae bacterium]